VFLCRSNTIFLMAPILHLSFPAMSSLCVYLSSLAIHFWIVSKDSVKGSQTSANCGGQDLARHSHGWPDMGPSGRPDSSWSRLARRRQISNLRTRSVPPCTTIWRDLAHLCRSQARSCGLARQLKLRPSKSSFRNYNNVLWIFR
jgi:hypothetical protein